MVDCISRKRAACLFKGVTREPRVVLLLHSANVRVNEVRLLSLGALRHHSSDCLRQRPSVGGYSSQFARTLLRLCFAKLLALLVGGPDDATACAPCGARLVASGNLTTSSQVHLVAGVSRAHPTRRLWRGRISWRCGDWEFGRRSSKSPKLQISQQRKQQKAFVCLYRLNRLVILGEWLGNTGLESSVMGENRGGYGCKDCLYRVKGLRVMGVRP